ncbi:MAG: ankyrin repeat domain-containing protein [bacterium]
MDAAGAPAIAVHDLLDLYRCAGLTCSCRRITATPRPRPASASSGGPRPRLFRSGAAGAGARPAPGDRAPCPARPAAAPEGGLDPRAFADPPAGRLRQRHLAASPHRSAPATGAGGLDEALVESCRRGTAQGVRRLLAAGASPNTRDRGACVLAIAAEHPDDDVARALLAAGADPDGPWVLGRTALTHAVARGRVALVAELLARGADPTAATPTYPRPSPSPSAACRAGRCPRRGDRCARRRGARVDGHPRSRPPRPGPTPPTSSA